MFIVISINMYKDSNMMMGE